MFIVSSFLVVDASPPRQKAASVQPAPGSFRSMPLRPLSLAVVADPACGIEARGISLSAASDYDEAWPRRVITEGGPGERKRMAQEEELQREKRLVAAMMAGDERAMEEFADRYIPPLYRFASARLRGDRELTRDIVQTTLCKALEKIAGFRGEASLASWLAACCRNEIRMHFRAAGRRPRLVELEAEARDARPARLGQPIPGPETRVLRDEKAEQVHAALDRLPPRYAAALEGKYVHRWSVRRVADELAITPKAAESLLGRARAAFRETYSRLVDSIVPLVEPASQRRSVR